MIKKPRIICSFGILKRISGSVNKICELCTNNETPRCKPGVRRDMCFKITPSGYTGSIIYVYAV